MRNKTILILATAYSLMGCTREVTVPHQEVENIDQADRIEFDSTKTAEKDNLNYLQQKAAMVFSSEFEELGTLSENYDKPSSETRFENIIKDFKNTQQGEN